MNLDAVGRYIAQLRKERGWTQRQLARQLSVSHQAVSKWEKGSALPDVESLVELARLFGLTVDNIISYDDTEADETNADDAVEIEIDATSADEDDVDDDGDEDNESANPKRRRTSEESLKMMINIAPFISRDVLSEKLMQYIDNNGLDRMDEIVELLPFIDKSALKAAFRKVADKKVNPELLVEMAPFVGRKTLKEMIEEMEDKSWIMENFAELAPFLPREYLDDIFRNLDFM